MGPPTISLVLVLVLGMTATVPRHTMVHAEGDSVPLDSSTGTNMTSVDSQCSPLQRRQDLQDARLIDIDNRMTDRDTKLTQRDTQLNGVDAQLNSRLNGVDARLNRIDSRFDELETAMSDMKEYLRQRMDALEVKAEWALAGTKHKEEVGCRDNQPNRTSQIPKDCQEAYMMGSTSSGVYRIAPEPNTYIDVYCEQELDGGGWTVFQQRKDGSVDFYRDWKTYKEGFGELIGEFWFGNHKIHLLTKRHDQQLKIEVMSADGVITYADYAQFWIENEAQKFKLFVTGYTGGSPPGDSMKIHNHKSFTATDRDNDKWSGTCSTRDHGAWWYGSCGNANLNGRYKGTGYTGVFWYTWKQYTSMKATRMLLRRRP